MERTGTSRSCPSGTSSSNGSRTATDLYSYGQIKQLATEALMIAAEDRTQRTGWTDPSQ